MKISHWLVVIGFPLGGVGLLAGIFLDRSFGILLFFVGFALALIGIVLSNLTISFPESLEHHGRGLRIGTIGFCIAWASIALREFATGAETVFTATLFIGFGVMIWGIVLIITPRS